MNKLLLLCFCALVAVLVAACTPKTAGQDSAYINANRGQEGAQITRQEARQYRRQQAIAADEVRLENMKRRQTTDAIHEGASATRHGIGAIRSIRNFFRGW